MSQPEPNDVEVLVEHITRCRSDITGVVVVDGNADGIVTRMLADGWTYAAEAEVVAGKRIRTLQPPEEQP